MRRSTDRIVAGTIAVVALVALAMQLVLILRNAGSVPTLLVRYFSFFTILSNIWVASVSIAVARGRGWMASPVARGAAALYIAVTGGIYVAILQGLWQPVGAQRVADSLLHHIVPVLYLLWWLACSPHRLLRWSDVPRWLLFPLAYMGWVFLRGAAVHEYPYFFMDLGKLAVGQIAVNCVAVALLFAVLGLVLVALDRWLPARHRV